MDMTFMMGGLRGKRIGGSAGSTVTGFIFVH